MKLNMSIKIPKKMGRIVFEKRGKKAALHVFSGGNVGEYIMALA